MASVIGCDGSAYPLPVPTYTAPRRTSMVGADQMPPPAGPHCGLPAALVPRDCRSPTVYVFQTTFPVLASSADDAAAERAAFVLRPSALHFLVEALDRHEDTAVVVGERPGDGGVRMLVDLADPDRTAARRVHRVRVGLQIAEEHRPSAGAGRQAVWRDEERRADGGFRAERPVGASGPGVERMDVAAVAGDEQAVADERRLRARGRDVGVAERPLQCQLRQVAGGQAAIPGESRVLEAVAPAVPIAGRAPPRETAATTCTPRRTIPAVCFAARVRPETPRRRAGRRRSSGVPWIRILPFSSALRIASGLNCRSAARSGAFAGAAPSGDRDTTHN